MYSSSFGSEGGGYKAPLVLAQRPLRRLDRGVRRGDVSHRRDVEQALQREGSEDRTQYHMVQVSHRQRQVGDVEQIAVRFERPAHRTDGVAARLDIRLDRVATRPRALVGEDGAGAAVVGVPLERAPRGLRLLRLVEHVEDSAPPVGNAVGTLFCRSQS